MFSALGIYSGLAAAGSYRDEASSSLTRLIHEALLQHPSLRAQASIVKASEAGVDGARWQYFPTPTISVEKAQTSQADPSYIGDKQVTVIGLRQPIWTGGRISAGVEKAQANAQRSASLLAETQQQITLRVIQSYAEWLSANQKQKIYSAGLATHEQLKDLVSRRVGEGLSAQSDLNLAEGRLSSIQADWLNASTQVTTSLSRLAQIIGRQIEMDEISENPAKALSVDESLADLLHQAENNAPVLQRARATALVQKFVIEEKQAEKSPEVFARLERQYGSYTLEGMNSDNRFFVGVATKFGAGLSTLSSISEAIHQYEASLADVETQQKLLNEQILVDYATLSQSASRLKALHQANDMSKQVLESWDRQFLSGRKSWQELMNAVREQVQSEVQITDAEVGQLLASWRLRVLTESGQSFMSSANR